MENVIYQKTITPAKQSPDGESPTILYVTEEANGYAVLLIGYEINYNRLVRWFHDRNEAIEFGVSHAENMMIDDEFGRTNQTAEVTPA